MYCAECGTANQNGAETCEVCGSPLGPPAGEQRCTACGSPVTELDRYCRACGASISGVQADVRYEPGPSFLSDDDITVDPSDLPPWLRELVNSAPMPVSTPMSPPPPTSASGLESQPAPAPVLETADDSLPAWLRTPRADELQQHPVVATPAAPAATYTAPEQERPSTTDSFSFISEDDLPEWLRALGEDDLSASTQTQTATPSMPASSRSETVITPVVPAISRAWLTRARSIDPVGAESVAGDFTPLEVPDRPADAVAQGSTTQPTTTHAAIDQSAGAVEPARARNKRVPFLLLVAALVVLIAIIAFVALGSLL